MNTFKIIKPYTTHYNTPIVLHAGDAVTVGEEEKNEKWKGWIWAETKHHRGWVPMQILDMSPDKKTARVLEFYTARELSVTAGDSIEKIRSLNGWTWSKNSQTYEEGWIPDEVINPEPS